MRLISICLLSILCLSGCASNKPEIIYKEVKVPVVYRIDRPKRPLYTSSDNAPSYMLKLRQYIITLETIIDEHNKKD